MYEKTYFYYMNIHYSRFVIIIILFQVVRAASPVLLRVIALGAFFMYGTVSTIDIKISGNLMVYVRHENVKSNISN